MSAYTVLRGSASVREETCCLLQFDGLSEPNPGTSTAGAVVFVPYTRDILFERGEFLDYATNNEAEYTGLWIGLQTAVEMGVQHLLIEGDSQLVIRQVEGVWKIKKDSLRAIHRRIQALLPHFTYVAIRHVYRDHNRHADCITNEVIRSRQSFLRTP